MKPLHELTDLEIEGHLNLGARSQESMRHDPFLCRDINKEIKALEDERQRRNPGIPFASLLPF